MKTPTARILATVVGSASALLASVNAAMADSTPMGVVLVVALRKTK